MIPVFRNHVRLYALTTALFSFISNTSIYVRAESSAAKSPQCEKQELPYDCSDGKIHTLEGKSYKFDFLGEPGGSSQPVPPLPPSISGSLAAMVASNAGTVIEATDIDIGGSLNIEDIFVPSGSGDYGAVALSGGKIILNNPSLSGVMVGVAVNGGGVEVNGGSIVAETGILAMGREVVAGQEVEAEGEREVAAEHETSVILTDTKIQARNQILNLREYSVINRLGAAVRMGMGANVQMVGGSINIINADGVFLTAKGKATLDGVTITANGEQVLNGNHVLNGAQVPNGEQVLNEENYAVLSVSQTGFIGFKNGKIDATNIHGLLIGNGVVGDAEFEQINGIDIENSTITVNGGGAYGMFFFSHHIEEEPNRQMQADEASILSEGGEENTEEDPGTVFERGVVRLVQTTFTVPDSTAIYSNGARNSVGLSRGAEISGDLLLKATEGSFVLIQAHSSSLKGGTHIDERSSANLFLTNGSKWTLTPSKREDPEFRDSDYSTSLVSYLRLSDSSVVFERPMSGKYQVLYVGEDEGGLSWEANGNARLYLNVGRSNDNKKADQLLIYGDVSGTTKVHIQSISESFDEVSDSENSRGVSVIQVFGKADENSFILDGGYMTLDALPYQHRLHAYGPSSSLGKATSGMKALIDGNRQIYEEIDRGDADFWDFRFAKKYTQLSPSRSHFGERVRAVVPQVSTYLLLPNALFHAGLIDISGQGKQLEIMRSASNGFLNNKQEAIFVRAHRESYHYTSNLSVLRYGYNADFNYDAVEAGISLKALESGYFATSFGVMGTYGKFSLKPQDVEDSQKNTFEKWSVAAHGNIQHDTGFYVDGFLSYGLFKGDISTVARGKTAHLKGKPLSASLVCGKLSVIGGGGLVFDPQIQLIYQRLLFDKTRDVDGFDIEIGEPSQWTMRVGGRLNKRFSAAEGTRFISLYGKLHFTSSFKDKQFVSLGDSFQLGALGSSLEAGVGVHAQLSSRMTLYTDLSYQHKLASAGFSGASFSGGLRYHF